MKSFKIGIQFPIRCAVTVLFSSGCLFICPDVNFIRCVEGFWCLVFSVQCEPYDKVNTIIFRIFFFFFNLKCMQHIYLVINRTLFHSWSSFYIFMMFLRFENSTSIVCRQCLVVQTTEQTVLTFYFLFLLLLPASSAILTGESPR